MSGNTPGPDHPYGGQNPNGPGADGPRGDQPGFGRPSGPGFGGGPGGPNPANGPQPGYGGGAPWTPQPQQPGPQGPGGYGPTGPTGPTGPQTWNPTGPQGYGGPQPPSPYPGGPGQPPKGGGRTKLVLMIAGGALVLLLIAVIGGVALFGKKNTPVADPDPTTTTAPAAEDQAGAVKGFLGALAAGNAKQALAYAANTPSDTTFLTDEVLKASQQAAPITDIQVAPVSSNYSTSVDASYKVGNSLVTGSFRVEKFGSTWKLENVANDVKLYSSSYEGLPLLVSGVKVTGDTIYLFPGTYAISTGSKYVTWGTSSITVKDPEGYVSMSGLSPKLTSAGTSAVTAAVKSAGEACVKERKATTSCGPSIHPPSGTKVDTSTIRWSVSFGSFSKLSSVRLNYEDGRQAVGYVSVGMKAKYVGTYKGRKTNFSSYSTEFVDKPVVNLFSEPLKVSWED
ncbi:hypothetical protein FHX74_000398 [Friedmanniella endophytica]|uniref:Uncharacterized protein n=1 Tax=Microlunatus kandeliicorticis TaxID=1759536 RepID=A0A7W3IPD8_9ACTN|nr:hypothetical protein [Microlunatus kandeliicorticis]MBA8792804.1 hypothetical protein [Microlunatus kandeliicorticis]